jgi:P27 family predicted phage terminase small subunit
MRGRKPTPTAILEARGSRKIDKSRRESEANIDDTPPDRPDFLSPDAAAEWDRIVSTLQGSRILTANDRGALAMLCQAYGRWVAAEREIAKSATATHGGEVVKSANGFPMKNPWLSVADAAYEQCRKLAVEFGLTPSSRSRALAAPRPKSDADKPADGKARFFTPTLRLAK